MYLKMLDYVNDCLKNNDSQATKTSYFPFRKRSDHIRRVLMWAERLVDDVSPINKEAVFVAAIFHDVGYAIDKSNHAENSAVICEQYLTKNGFDTEFINLVTYLVKNHSKKEWMTVLDTPLELILLMEADLLDETGALSIVWDSMMEGSQPLQTFEKTYHHIMNYSYKSLNANPMVTARAKEYWETKQNLLQAFTKHLAFDLGL